MSDKKVFTSSIPEVREKQVERAKAAIREQMPLIIECLVEDDVLLHQLAEALESVKPTHKMRITNTTDEGKTKK